MCVCVLSCVLLFAAPRTVAFQVSLSMGSSAYGKGVRQVCILSPCLFNLMQSISWVTLGWKSTSWNQDCQEKYQ